MFMVAQSHQCVGFMSGAVTQLLLKKFESLNFALGHLPHAKAGVFGTLTSSERNCLVLWRQTFFLFDYFAF